MARSRTFVLAKRVTKGSVSRGHRAELPIGSLSRAHADRAMWADATAGASPSMMIGRFRTNDQGAVRELILDGLEEHWGTLDPLLNSDLEDIEASYAHGSVLVACRSARNDSRLGRRRWLLPHIRFRADALRGRSILS